jgi:uncharacterized protein with von Willebrand factor type A (vWA) domain
VNNKATALAYTTKNCETCGKEFKCYRNRGRWCKDCLKERQLAQHRAYAERKKLKGKITPRIHENALTRARKRGTSYEYELTKILKGYDPLRKPNKNAKINTMEEKKTMEYNKPLDSSVENAINNATKRERSCANKRAAYRKTGYLYELNRILTGVEPIRTGAGRPQRDDFEEPTQPVQEEPVEQEPEEVETIHESDYLGTLELAIEIVRGVKDEEDVKLAVDKVFETLKYHLTK